MLDFFYSIDLAIFYFVNHTLSCGFLDKFFSILTNVNNWYIAYLILLGIVFFKGGRRGKLSVILVIILIVFTDQLGHKVIKEFFQRSRPCNALPDVRAVLGCNGTYSFPSNHALNNFAAAVFFTLLYPNYKWILFITASLVALSRVYLGLHYPSDIIGGALIGSCFGYIFALAALQIDKFLISKHSK